MKNSVCDIVKKLSKQNKSTYAFLTRRLGEKIKQCTLWYPYDPTTQQVHEPTDLQ